MRKEGAGGDGGEEKVVFLHHLTEGLLQRGTHTHPGHTLPGALGALKLRLSR